MLKSVLIIEDDKDLAHILSHRLKREGYEVLTADDGKTGVTTAKEKLPSLVLLDVMLPEKDGFEVLSDLKKDKNTKAIPIILITAKNQESDITYALGQGADDYLIKPFSIPELLLRVKKQIRPTST